MDAGISFQRSADGKAEHRRRMADLPYPEKVRIVVELQKIATPILNARGITVTPWRLDEAQESADKTSL